MERRTFLAVALAITFLLGYQFLLVKLYPPSTRAIPQPQASVPATVPQQMAAPVVHPDRPEQHLALQNEALRMEVSSDGGSIAHVQLNEFTDPTTHQPAVITDPPPSLIRAGSFTELIVNGVPLTEPTYTMTVQGNVLVAEAIGTPGLQLTKQYQVHDHLINGTVRLTNTSAQPLTVRYALAISSPLRRGIHEGSRGAGTPTGLALVDGKLTMVSPAKARKRAVELPGEHTLAGQAGQYFAWLATWEPPSDNIQFNAHGDNGLQISTAWSQATIAPAATQTIHLTWYAGPREYRKVLAANPRMATLFPQGLLGTLGTTLLSVLRFFHHLTQNYGVAIILLTCSVSTVLFPLTWLNIRMSRDAMTKMQVIQPKLDRLKEQHKDNPQKLNREMMELYKKHGINPFAQLGGCLPLLLQFPVFISLYNTIRNSLELRGAQFLWIRDLSATDHAFVVGGFAVNALPLLMMGAMFLQMKLSPMKPAAATPGTPNMTTMMTIMFGVMFYSLPSALVLYWLTNTLVMTLVYVAMRPRPAPQAA